MPSPVKSPAILLVVNLPSNPLSLLPARLSKACPMIFIPNRNRLKPPINVSKLNISIENLSSHFLRIYFYHLTQKDTFEKLPGHQSLIIIK
jgi:hypothetical protein